MAADAESEALLAELPPPVRLAVAYAPAHARGLWTGLLALDHRLSRSVAGASEPLLAQVRLAWWRDRLRTPAAQWPAGEPLLATLAPFDRERPALEALADAWEGMIGDAGNAVDSARLADARAGAVAALARMAGSPADERAVRLLTQRWTAPGTAPPGGERGGRILRPLVILANLPDPSRAGPLAFLRIVRLGLLGR